MKTIALILASLGAFAPVRAAGPWLDGQPADRAASAAEPFLPTTVIAAPGGPRLVVLATPYSPVVALRLSVPVEETFAEAGAGQILLELALERAAPAAARLGARFEAARTPWGLAYTVTGAGADFDHLASLLRLAAAEPRPDRLSFQRARDRVRSEVERSLETADGLLHARLLDRVGGGKPPTLGSLSSLTRMSVRELAAFWARTHQKSRMTLVLAGAVSVEAVLAAFHEIGAPPAATAPEPPQPAVERPSPPRVQVLRTWYGQAIDAGASGDPRAAVAAVLMGERIGTGSSSYEVGVELWETGPRLALAISGAALSRDSPAMRSRVQGLLAETASTLTDGQVDRAVSRVRMEMLTAGRTHDGLVRIVGRHLDASGDPGEARSYLAALDELDLGAMRSYLVEVRRAAPIEAEIRP